MRFGRASRKLVGGRRAVAIAVSLALTLPAWTAIHAETVTQSVNETVNVPGEVPGAFVCVDAECVEVLGVKDVSIHVQATGVVTENTTLGTTGANCARVDRSIQLTLAAGAIGAVTLSYTMVDPETGIGAPQDEQIPFGSGPGGGSTPTVKLCVR